MSVYVLLVAAIAAEVMGTLAIRAADGFTRPVPSAIVVVGYGTAFYLLSLVLRELDIGFVYAVWAGAGTALVAAIGMAFLGESTNAVKVASLVLVIAGVIGLNLSAAH